MYFKHTLLSSITNVVVKLSELPSLYFWQKFIYLAVFTLLSFVTVFHKVINGAYFSFIKGSMFPTHQGECRDPVRSRSARSDQRQRRTHRLEPLLFKQRLIKVAKLNHTSETVTIVRHQTTLYKKGK